MQKILVIRFSSLGDLILTTPIYREIKKVYPNSNITVLTSFEVGNVLENNPYIDNLIRHKRKENFKDLKNLISNLRKEKFDLIYDAHRSLRSIWIVWNLKYYRLSKIPKVWFIKKRSFKKYFLIYFKLNLLKETSPQRIHLLKPLQDNSNIQLKDHTEIFPDKKTNLFIKQFMKKKGLFSKKFIAIGPSASYPLKRWPVNYFIRLISVLIKKGWPIVLFGGKNESETIKIEKHFSGKLHNVAGDFSALESAELLKQARITLTNDTSICHLSEAMGTPAIVFFGPTVKEFGYKPFLKESIILETYEKLYCRPCSKDGRGKCFNSSYLRCLTKISPENVISLIPENVNT